jgi:dTDP-glucose 4,6-dehydratase
MKTYLQKLLDKFNKTCGWFFTNGQRTFEKESQRILPKRSFKRVLVTGGAGFIGSHLVKFLVINGYEVTVLDCLTYAGDMKNLKDVPFRWWKIDITDMKSLKKAFKDENFDAILHLAAESHVDRSIENPLSFLHTNVNGTVNMLEIALKQHKKNPNFVFYHISTDEVFGTLDPESDDMFSELTPYDPRSPYSASKASSDHFVRAYHHTYNLPILISNCSNNYGTHQYPEKLIPIIIRNLVENTSIPIYGTGFNQRDWLNVVDHAHAIHTILVSGRIGETYCVGGKNVMSNLELTRKICDLYDEMYETAGYRLKGSSFDELVTFVKDRKGHDLKYAIDASKMQRELEWEPSVSFEKGLKETIKWYVNLYKNE